MIKTSEKISKRSCSPKAPLRSKPKSDKILPSNTSNKKPNPLEIDLSLEATTLTTSGILAPSTIPTKILKPSKSSSNATNPNETSISNEPNIAISKLSASKPRLLDNLLFETKLSKKNFQDNQETMYISGK